MIGDAPQGEHDMQPYRSAMENFEFNRALDEVWTMIRSVNQYIDEVKPWEIAKNTEKDSDAEGHLSEVLAHCVGNLLQIADLLVPFLPNTASYIHTMFESGVVVAVEGVMFPKKYLHTQPPQQKQGS